MVAVVKLADKKQCICYTCKSTLEYNYQDITESVEKDYGGGSDRVYRIFCPVCSSRPTVSRWK